VIRASKDRVKIRRRPVILLALCVVAVASAGLAGRGSGSAAAPTAGGPDSRTQPLADGCARAPGAILSHQVPNWVYVGGGLAQDQLVSGMVNSQYDQDRAAHPAPIDDPFTHTSYDFTFNVEVDPEYAPLLGTGNFEGQGQETARLHMERESASFPVFAWPDRGDRISLAGSWVWDCDHTGVSGERTEIHPFRVLWVERNPGGPSPRSAVGDREADLFVTNAGTPADTQAICANRTKGDRVAFKQCVSNPVEEVAMHGKYEFVLRAAKKPSPKARLVYRVVERFAPSIPTPVTRLEDGISVQVDASRAVAIESKFFVGWRPVKPAARPVHLRVRLRELLVRRAMDPGCPPYDLKCPAKDESTRIGQMTTSPGEWNMYVNVAGVWAPWKPILLQPKSGQTIRTRQTIDAYVARGKPWRLFVQVRECDFGSAGNAYSIEGTVSPCPRANEIGSEIGDDEPGILVAQFRSPQASLGTHRTNSILAGSTCPASNRQGCYRLTYTISRIRR
jgi:hypothetical protein